jgi:hypothetical protein
MQSLSSYTPCLSKSHTSLRRLWLALNRQIMPQVILSGGRVDVLRGAYNSNYHLISSQVDATCSSPYHRIQDYAKSPMAIYVPISDPSILLAMSPHRCRPRWKSTGNSNLSLLTDRRCDRRWTCISAATVMPNAPNAIMIFGLPCLSRLGRGNGLAKAWVLT